MSLSFEAGRYPLQPRKRNVRCNVF